MSTLKKAEYPGGGAKVCCLAFKEQSALVRMAFKEFFWFSAEVFVYLLL
jgi:hypothetical protein